MSHATGQGHQVQSPVKAASATGAPTVPVVGVSVESALQLFNSAQERYIQGTAQLSGTQGSPGLLSRDIELRQKRDATTQRIGEMESNFIAGHDWNQYGPIGKDQSWRKSKMLAYFQQDEGEGEYAVLKDQLEEQTKECRQCVADTEVCLLELTIARQQMEFSTAIIHSLSSITA